VNNKPAPIFSVSNVNGQEQINFQYPWEALPGDLVPNSSFTSSFFIVTNNGISSEMVFVGHHKFYSPGIFTTDGTTAAAFHGVGFAPVTSADPASPGETVVLYATGLGPVSSNPGSGNPAPMTPPLSETNGAPDVTVGGVPAVIRFSGLAPGYVGLYQVNIELPANVPSGNQDVIIQRSTQDAVQASQPAKIAIQ
jgi:uncharacterized protein (TIGR03437 family)